MTRSTVQGAWALKRVRRKVAGIAHCATGTELCAPGGPSWARRGSPIILLSTSDHFMIMSGALLIIFTASLQFAPYTLAMLAKRV